MHRRSTIGRTRGPILVICGAACVAATGACASHRPNPGPAPELVPTRPKPIIKGDLAAATFDSVLPFDRPWVLRVAVPTGLDSLVVRYGPYACIDGPPADVAKCSRRRKTEKSPIFASDQQAIEVEALLPNTAYEFRFRACKTDSTKSTPATAPPAPKLVCDTRTLTGWTATYFNDHFDTDFGAVYGVRARYEGLGVALHLYLEPVRASEDLNTVNVPSLYRRWAKRISATAGISLVKIAADKPVDNLYSFGSPFAGFTLRNIPGLGSGSLASVTRLNAGLIWYSQSDANPIVSRKRTKADYYVGLTFSPEVKSALGAIYSLLGFK